MAAPDKSFGRYTLEKHLASGGMADTWKASWVGPQGVKKLVALKRVKKALAGDEKFNRLFIAEAKISTMLSHGNIAQVFDFGEVDGEAYLAMELVDGPSLAHVLKRAAEKGEPTLPTPIALYIATEACKGLQYAHSRTDDQGKPLRLVHRDVNPENLLVSYEGQVKLIDFGIANAIGVSRRETEPGQVRGKFQYFSPEQIAFQPIDARSDLFALGVVLYFMVTGKLPFSGQLHEVTHQIKHGEFTRPTAVNPDLPPELERIIVRALATNREARYQTAADLQTELTEVLHKNYPGVSSEWLAAYLGDLFGVELERAGRVKLVPSNVSGPLERARRNRSTQGLKPVTTDATMMDLPPVPEPEAEDSSRTFAMIDPVQGPAATAAMLPGVPEQTAENLPPVPEPKPEPVKPPARTRSGQIPRAKTPLQTRAVSAQKPGPLDFKAEDPTDPLRARGGSGPKAVASLPTDPRLPPARLEVQAETPTNPGAATTAPNPAPAEPREGLPLGVRIGIAVTAGLLILIVGYLVLAPAKDQQPRQPLRTMEVEEDWRPAVRGKLAVLEKLPTTKPLASAFAPAFDGLRARLADAKREDRPVLERECRLLEAGLKGENASAGDLPAYDDWLKDRANALLAQDRIDLAIAVAQVCTACPAMKRLSQDLTNEREVFEALLEVEKALQEGNYDEAKAKFVIASDASFFRTRFDKSAKRYLEVSGNDQNPPADFFVRPLKDEYNLARRIAVLKQTFGARPALEYKHHAAWTKVNELVSRATTRKAVLEAASALDELEKDLKGG